MDFLVLGGLGLAAVIICDSFAIADWTDAAIFDEHDSELVE
jgi:hypothetical protein